MPFITILPGQARQLSPEAAWAAILCNAMLGLISSDKVLIGVVAGIPLITFALIAFVTHPRVPRPAAIGASLVAAVLVVLAIWAVFRPGQKTVAAGAQLATLPRGAVTGPVIPSGPPSAPPPSPPSPAAPACAPSGTALQIAAQAVAFDKACLAAPANTAFTIAFDNRDAGVPHNLELFSDPSASRRLGGATDASDFVTGPKQITYRVTALAAGEYFFRCDLHPAQMHGTFVVA
jgi:plastocyanin